MPQTGAAGFRRSDRDGDLLPPPIVGFDPVGDIVAYDTRASARAHDAGGGTRDAGTRRRDVGDGARDVGASRRDAGRSRWVPDDGAAESRAAARAAMAEAFAAQFGVDEEGPSAASLADRFGFRFEEAPSGPAGRRTVTITGHGAERSVPPAERSVRPGGGAPRRRDSRSDTVVGLHADRAALWAVGLAIVLALVAAMSAHALPLG